MAQWKTNIIIIERIGSLLCVNKNEFFYHYVRGSLTKIGLPLVVSKNIPGGTHQFKNTEDK